MGAIFKAIFFIFLAMCAQRILRIYTLLGGFSHFHQHHPGPCKQVEGIQLGSEDFQMLSNGQTFISSGLRYAALGPKTLDHFRRQEIRGRIYLMDLHHPTHAPKELKISPSSLFHLDTFVPHGISVWEDKKSGRHTVFVVNHCYQPGPMDSRVEKFVYEPDRQELVHLTTYIDPSMTVLNDVQATGENSFYFTNCNYFRTMEGILLEIMLEMTLNTVVHYDGHSYTVVDQGLSSPNGVAMSKDQKTLYVADMSAGKIMVYRRNPDNTLTRKQEYPVYTWPDNIQVDEATGHLYIASSPIPFQSHKYIEDISTEVCPSQVIQLQVVNDTITSAIELMYDHGDLVSASSSALVFKGTLLVGSVFDHLVTCQVNTPLFP